MKKLNQTIKIIQFTLAVLLIVSMGWQLISFLNNWWNTEIKPFNLSIFSFSGFIILGIISFFLREKH